MSAKITKVGGLNGFPGSCGILWLIEKPYLCSYSISGSENKMAVNSQIRQRFEALNCCVIIPTFNNDGTLERILRDVLDFTDNVIVVNDGSTDKTEDILHRFPDIAVVSYSPNKGKGNALIHGFRHAIEKGFRYAVTIDSDGQHFADDLPKLLDKVEEIPDSMVIGARKMNQQGIPGTSNFGHNFSIFWFRVETGQKVSDVQSGYRLYPLEHLKKMRFFGKKYEFEVEVLVRLAWRNVVISSVPVKVWYAPKGERISHFRKFKDFTRVSVVNSILVFIALLWINPFKFLKALRKTSVKKFIHDYILNSHDSNSKIMWSVSLGVFLGVIPIWGFQMLVAFSVAYFLKLNRFITVAASNISIPPVLPFILLLSYMTGGFVLGRPNVISYKPGMAMEWVKTNLLQYLVGSLCFALILAITLGLVTFILLHIFRKTKRNGNTDPGKQIQA